VSLALTSSRAALFPGQWVRNELWRRARAVPSLDLRFADNKSLTDATSGRNLVTFTRASSGTYVGSDGLLKTATTNLLLRSEEFGTTWTATGASVSSNTVAAPNGTVTAETLIEDSSTGDHRINQASLSLSNGFCTYSVYLKASTRSAARIQFDGTVGGTASSALVDINLSTGVASGLAVTGNITNGSAGVLALLDGWYRVSLTASLSAAATGISTRIFLLQSAGGASSYTGNGTGSVFAWGAQLEQSSTVGEYIPTTSTINSAPRFDHNPTTGESLGLLVEEQRTNLLLRSEEFDNASWSKPQSDTITANSISSPTGATTADSFVENTASGATHTLFQDGTIVANSSNTFSCFFKSAGRTQILIKLSSTDDVNGCNATFDLSTGTVSAVANYGTGSGASASIQALPSGWYRCIVSGNIGSSLATTRIRIRSLFGGNEIYTGNGTAAYYIWGAQLEAGAFPTSYVPTTTATVTRSADVASITGANFSSWYRQDEGTVFTDIDRNTSISSASTAVSINDNSSNNRLHNFRQDSASALTVISVTGGTLDGSPLLTLLSTSTRNRVAAAQALNSLSAVANGATAVSDTSVAMPVVNQMQIGNVTGVSYYNGTIRRLTYWPQRLPNSTLQAVTQ
jgi:hypothetical protein